MYRFYYSCLWLSFVLLASPAFAQSVRYVESNAVKVFKANGQEKNMAWAGGFNNPQFCLADINKDGKPDLVIYEKGTEQVKTFINTGSAGNPVYTYSPIYQRRFPPVSGFLKLEDYNRDGVPDLIHRGSRGFAIYKGAYNGSNELIFSFYKDLFYNGPFGSTNAYSEPSDLPAVIDIDDDGDLDFLSFSNTGNLITLYKNIQVEQSLPKDSIVVCVKDECWGKAYQAFDRIHSLGIACYNTNATCAGIGQIDEDNSGEPNALFMQLSERTALHTGNALCILDIDGDGDKDVLDGNVSFADLQLLVNGRTQYGKDTMVAQDTLWQSNGHQAYMPNWAAPYWLDIDQDGKKDILISPHSENISENYKCIAWYKNTGTVTNPVFTYQSDTLFVEKTIDVGSASVPYLYDYNKDGKPDLFIASDGFYQANGSFVSKISYYRNTSTSGNPSFVFETDDFLNLSARGYEGASIAIGDIDNDGKDDLLLGHVNGRISFYKNIAASAGSQPNWQLAAPNLQNSNGTTIATSGYATPLIYDIDKDGKKDLIIGYLNGALYYYRNIGGSNDVRLEYKTDRLGGVKVQAGEAFTGYSTPFIGKIDASSDTEYLMIGSDNGTIYRYTGFQNGNVTTPYQLLDSVYSNIKGLKRSAPVFGDVDGDGDIELFVGNTLGGLHLYKMGVDLAVDEKVKNNAASQFFCYPNPANTQLTVSRKSADPEQYSQVVSVQLLSVSGTLVLQSQIDKGKDRVQISLEPVPNGVYLCRLHTKTGSEVQRIVILK